jgi:hypothetical protein
MPAVIGSNLAARIAGLARQKVLEGVAKSGRNPRPLLDFALSRKRTGQFTGNGVMVGIKEVAHNIAAQTWSGDVTLQDPAEVQNMLMAEFKPSNMFANMKWGFDDLRKASGVTIIPNDNGAMSADARQFARDPSSERVLYNRLTEDMESFEDRTQQLIDLALHRPGTASTDDLTGLFSLLPLNNAGTFAGLSRELNPSCQHVVFAGAIIEQAGIPWMGARGTTGASGTLIAQLEKFIRTLRNQAYMSGLPRGKWKMIGGSGFFDKFKAQARLENLQFNLNADAKNSMVNILLTDERLGLNGDDMQMVLDYTLDAMDTDYSSEIGLAPSQLTLTFSGGTGGTRAPKAFANVTAGVITSVTVVDRGAGYTATPSIAIGNGGSGSGGSITCTVFSATTGVGKTQVDADDVRIGQLATVTIANGGTGYPTTALAAPATNRLIALYEPAWEYHVQEGLDNLMSIPADNPRARRLEQQWDHSHALINRAPRCSGVFVAD